MKFEKIIAVTHGDQEAPEGTVSNQIWIPFRVHEFAVKYVVSEENEHGCTLGDVYLNLILKAIAKLRKEPDMFNWAKQSKADFLADTTKGQTIFIPSHVIAQIKAIKEQHGGKARRGIWKPAPEVGKIPQRQILKYLMLLGYELLQKELAQVVENH